MCRDAWRRILPGMGETTITIILELRVEGETLVGRVLDEDGGERPFDGWLGLVAAIDALVSAPDRNRPQGGQT